MIPALRCGRKARSMNWWRKDYAARFREHPFAVRTETLGAPLIVVTSKAAQKMWHYVDIAPEEVGWLGLVRRLEPLVFEIEDVYLFKQQVTGVTTRIAPEAVYEMQRALANQGATGEDLMERIRFWGHSHVNMDTGASGQDETQAKLFSYLPFFIRGILNKRGKMEFTLFLWESGIILRDVPWTILPAETDSMRISILQEFAQKVCHAVRRAKEGGERNGQ